jgi:hypothetical protein
MHVLERAKDEKVRGHEGEKSDRRCESTVLEMMKEGGLSRLPGRDA